MDHSTVNPSDKCEQEQLHYSNAIQPIGALLAINRTGIITHASANTQDVLGVNAEQLLNQAIDKALGKAFNIHAGEQTTLPKRRIIFGAKLAWNKSLDIAITEISDGHLVELQSIHNKFWFRLSHASDITAAAGYSFSTSYKQDLKNLMLNAVRTIRSLSGFSRAMIYQFHEDWSGEVVVEVGGEQGADSYLGLRFPATDIPKIARDLYLKTPYRFIPDVTAVNIPIISRDSQPLDLTYADLRSVSPMHIAYMKNMQVGASFSLPIITHDQLWGLVALHHPTARSLTLDVRNECAKVVSRFNLALKAHTAMQLVAVNTAITPKIKSLAEQLQSAGGNIQAIPSVAKDLLSLLDANGGALLLEDQLIIIGQTPNEALIRSIDAWFVAKNSTEAIATDCLSSLLPETKVSTDLAAGVLAVGSNRKGRAMRMYWFRPGLTQEIYWAGNPLKPPSSSDNNLDVSPRNSFKKWVEVTKARCRTWTNADHIAAMDIRTSFADIIFK